MGKTIAAVIAATALAVSGWTYAIARPATVHNITLHRYASCGGTRRYPDGDQVEDADDYQDRHAGGSGTPCFDFNGAVSLSLEFGAGSTPTTVTCTGIATRPLSSGDVTFTAPDGASITYAPPG